VSLTGPPCENDRQITLFKPRFRPGFLKLCFSLELPPRVFTHVNKLLPDTRIGDEEGQCMTSVFVNRCMCGRRFQVSHLTVFVVAQCASVRRR